ncbi:MAG: class I SAM-dependent methyltransferase [Polyangiaceae bacterium]|nr:class I SAM-dependent methyltransferase [Polyangiaceae bacterium]
MNPGEHAVMAQVEATHWWYAGLREAITKTLASGRFRLPDRPRVLDAGCGTGQNLHLYRELFSPSYLAGFDLSAEAIDFARQKVQADDLYLSDICDPIVKERDLDLITSFDVIAITGAERAREGLRRLVEHLRPGGFFLINVPAYMWLHSEHDVAVHTTQRFTVPELETLYRRIGLEPVFSTYRVFFLFPAMVASRLVHMPRARAGKDIRSDLHAPPGKLVSAAFRSALRLENALMARGLSFPFGGSVFVLGRKPPG